jgi:RHS repeat-associated protein
MKMIKNPNLGDVNNSGSIDIVDAMLISKYEAGLDPDPFIVDRADVNYDGNINATDSLLVAQYYSEIITVLPPPGTEIPEDMLAAYKDYSFTGKKDDPEVNLVYFNARYYDPEIGRFTTVDPIKSGVNWYVYCENNPLKYFDPDGLDPMENLYKSLDDSFYNHFGKKEDLSVYDTSLALTTIFNHLSTINEVSNEYDIANIYIMAIMFRELRCLMPFEQLAEFFGFGKSVGIAQISIGTAKDAFQFIYNKVMPLSDWQLRFKLNTDEKFSIRTVAMILAIISKDGITNPNDIVSVLARYNGNGPKADEYGRQVSEYVEAFRSYFSDYYRGTGHGYSYFDDCAHQYKGMGGYQH